MLQQPSVRDFVIASGRSASLEYFVAQAFAHFGLDWQQHVRIDATLLRPSDIRYGAADPTLARRMLGWQAQRQVDEVVSAMCEAATALYGSKN